MPRLEAQQEELSAEIATCVAQGLAGHPSVDSELDLRLYRVPFTGPSKRARAWVEEKRASLGIPSQATGRVQSVHASEASFSGTQDVILMGPEGATALTGAVDCIGSGRVSDAAELTARLLARLVG